MYRWRKACRNGYFVCDCFCLMSSSQCNTNDCAEYVVVVVQSKFLSRALARRRHLPFLFLTIFTLLASWSVPVRSYRLMPQYITDWGAKIRRLAPATPGASLNFYLQSRKKQLIAYYSIILSRLRIDETEMPIRAYVFFFVWLWNVY